MPSAGGGRRSGGGTLDVGENARLDWLPQETILFDRAALHRITRIDLAPGARTCLFAEMH